MKTRNAHWETLYCVLLHSMPVVRSYRENLYEEELCKVAFDVLIRVGCGLCQD